MAPLAATTVLAFALVAFDPVLHKTMFAIAAALVCVVLVLGATSAPATRRLRACMPLLFLAAVFLLRHAAGGSTAGMGVLAMLPICWIALEGTRRELFVALAFIAALWTLPVWVFGGDEYPVTQLRAGALFVAVAALVGVSVQALVGEFGQHARNDARIAEAARAISTAPDARHEICRAACDVGGASFAYLFEPSADRRLHSTAMAGSAVDHVVIDPATDVSAACQAFRTGQAVFAPRASELKSINRRIWEAHDRPASMLFEPVVRGETTVGVLVVGWAQPVSELHSGGPALIALLAAEAGSAIAYADLVGRLGRLAATDPLTGLANRRVWDRELENALSADDGQGLCVAMLDLDHFKAYNDAHGHLAGDRLLKEAAAEWKAQLRRGDVLARLGGEKFAVLLPVCRPADARAVVQRLRAATPGGQTCSAGLAGWWPGESAEALMARADEALYLAKDTGRDRLVTAA